MKKSEIIKLMVDTAKYHDGAYLEPYAAEKLLEALEVAGMLPPKIELGDSGFVKTTEILDYCELDYRIEWEPEDE